MRLPMRTTRPPISAGSIFTSRSISALATSRSADLISPSTRSEGCSASAHLGLDDALRLGDEGAEAADHVGQREQPPVPRDEADEVLGEPADAGPFEDRRDGLLLRLGAKDRAPDQPPQVLALADERVEGVEVAGDRIDRLVVARELEQRGGVAARHARNHGSALRTLFSHRLLSIWSRARHGGAGRRLETRSGHWIDARKRQKAPPHGAAALAWDFGGRKASTERSFKQRPRARARRRGEPIRRGRRQG